MSYTKTTIYALECARENLLQTAAMLKQSHALEDGTWDDPDRQLEHCECVINSFRLFYHIKSLRLADSILNPSDVFRDAESN